MGFIEFLTEMAVDDMRMAKHVVISMFARRRIPLTMSGHSHDRAIEKTARGNALEPHMLTQAMGALAQAIDRATPNATTPELISIYKAIEAAKAAPIEVVYKYHMDGATVNAPMIWEPNRRSFRIRMKTIMVANTFHTRPTDIVIHLPAATPG